VLVHLAYCSEDETERLAGVEDFYIASLTHEIDAELRDSLKELPLNGQKDLAAQNFVALKEKDGVIGFRSAS
jgi:hypothetical protein